jgi:hypothetical protein
VKEALEVAASHDCALAELARDELAAANGLVNRITTEVGHSAHFVDRICEPAFGAGDLWFGFHSEKPSFLRRMAAGLDVCIAQSAGANLSK